MSGLLRRLCCTAVLHGGRLAVPWMWQVAAWFMVCVLTAACAVSTMSKAPAAEPATSSPCVRTSPRSLAGMTQPRHSATPSTPAQPQPTSASHHPPHCSTPSLPPGKPLRMPISDVFKTKQGAVTVGGKLEGGAMRPGSKVLLVPGYEPATVKSIEVSGQPVQLARAGDSADVVLTGVDASNLAIGAVLCHPEYPVPVVRRVEMQVVVLDVTVPVLKGQAVTLHAHCTREAGHISALLALLNAKTGGWSVGCAAGLLPGCVCRLYCCAGVWVCGCMGSTEGTKAAELLALRCRFC